MTRCPCARLASIHPHVPQQLLLLLAGGVHGAQLLLGFDQGVPVVRHLALDAGALGEQDVVVASCARSKSCGRRKRVALVGEL